MFLSARSGLCRLTADSRACPLSNTRSWQWDYLNGRTGSICPGPVGANYTGADANLLVEYKMQAAGDTDACSGTSCSGFCTTFTSNPSNCGACGTACATGQACVSRTCNGSSCGAGQTNCNGLCVNEQTDPNNCSACGSVCKQGTSCNLGVCTIPCPSGQVLL